MTPLSPYETPVRASALQKVTRNQEAVSEVYKKVPETERTQSRVSEWLGRTAHGLRRLGVAQRPRRSAPVPRRRRGEGRQNRTRANKQTCTSFWVPELRGAAPKAEGLKMKGRSIRQRWVTRDTFNGFICHLP